MKPQIDILILDDEPDQAEEVCQYLTRKGYRVRCAYRPSEAFHAMETEPPDILVLDIRLPEMSGIEVLKRAKENYPTLEVIMITGHGDIDSVIESMRYGAFDFLRKPIRLIDLQASIERTGKYLNLNRAYQRLEDSHSLISNELQRRINANIVGCSQAIQQVIEQARIASEHPTTNVLITGESGTGKELIAQMIHYNSIRRDHMFCDVNCAAIPATLFESEFFGHMRGAFTGATADKKGYLEMSDGGTLMLDELLDLPLDMQAKLLRALETHRIRRVGSNHDQAVDLRVISTSIQKVEAAVQEGRFRLDLYHRLNTIFIPLPPLRERPEDIPVLIGHFMEDFAHRMGKRPPCSVEELARDLGNYPFPGNVRELRNLIERVMIFADTKKISTILRDTLSSAPSVTPHSASKLSLEQIEREGIIQALEQTGYHQQKTAAILGIARQTLARKILKYEIPLFRKSH